MASRPLIGVTGNDRRWSPSWWCTRLALRLAGARPYRISTRHRRFPETLDAIIIGGGDDINPQLYDAEHDGQGVFDLERDKLEIEFIRHALEQHIPILGICRGAQLINVVLGGNLHSDLRPMRRLTHNRPGLLPTKTVALTSDSRCARIFGSDRLKVNSLHYQAVKEAGLGLLASGHDLDQIVQCIEHRPGRDIIGVQWHPEYLFYLPSQRKIFRWLVRSAC